MTWAPKNKGGEERKAESGAEEPLGCLNGDTKGIRNAHHPTLGIFQPSIGLHFCSCLVEQLTKVALPYLPLHLYPTLSPPLSPSFFPPQMGSHLGLGLHSSLCL